MTKFLLLVALVCFLVPLFRRFVSVKWPKFDFSSNPLVTWTACSLAGFLLAGFLIFSGLATGLLLFPVVVLSILSGVVLVGCAVNWALRA